MNSSSDGLEDAMNGRRGRLSAWLTCRSEDEIRAAIFALLESSTGVLRDKFAARAMQAWLSSDSTEIGGKPIDAGNDDHVQKIALVAYKQADAMLKAREAKP